MIPDLKSGSTRDVIINLLSDRWPLSAKKIYIAVRKTKRVSYHAVYKTVKQLVFGGVLEENDKNYYLSKKWIENVSNFSQKLSANYAKRFSGQPNTLVFETAADVDNYLMSMPSEEGDVRVVQCRHLWWALFRPETAYFRMEKDRAYKNQTYVVCSGDTPIDRWCASFEGKLKKNIKLGTKTNGNCDVFVRGDLVLEVYYPEPLMEFLGKKYESVKNVGELNLRELISGFYRKKAKILVVMNRNRKVAEHIRKVTVGHFRINGPAGI